jgi:hypothetical protein
VASERAWRARRWEFCWRRREISVCRCSGVGGLLLLAEDNDGDCTSASGAGRKLSLVRVEGGIGGGGSETSL